MAVIDVEGRQSNAQHVHHKRRFSGPGSIGSLTGLNGWTAKGGSSEFLDPNGRGPACATLRSHARAG
ncbi:MAG: hypothetical protein Q8M96_09355, partial [Rubrivivax sp.]|nr:hypothetical protein [Rubrivivax sp.]